MRKVLIAVALTAMLLPAGGWASNLGDMLVASVPKLALLKKSDPVAFERIVTIYEEGTKSGKSQDELIGLAREAFMRTHATRVARAPDALLLQASDSMLAVIKDLHARDPERCAVLLSGGNAGDIKSLLSPETIASEDAVYDAMLTYRAQPFTPAASATDEGAFMAAALATEAGIAGEQPRAFVVRMFASPETYCSLQRTLLERMRRAPNAVALFRRRHSID